MTRLIVNADDFGQTPGINRAVLELHKAGVLTSATLMARVRTRLRASHDIERETRPVLREFPALHLIPFSEHTLQH